MIYPWGDSNRWNSYAAYFRRTFGERLQKLTIDAGFSCPNRDGTVGWGGCAYCNNDAFNPSYCHPSKPIAQQIEEGIAFHTVRYRNASRYLAYFQAYSNTHAPLGTLQRMYEEALASPLVAGLVIGTRPDCIDEEKLDYFAELSQRVYLMIEYGVESCYDATLLRINRGHDAATAFRAIEATAARGIRTGAHFIFGLPGESRADMMNQLHTINRLPLLTLKFHQLQLVKDTLFAREYASDPSAFSLFEMEEYIEFFVDFLERLNPYFVVERFVNEVPPRYLYGPGFWPLRNQELWKLLISRLEARNTWQGKFYIPNTKTNLL